MNTFTYIPSFIKESDRVFNDLILDLEWEKRGSTPRMEYYSNKINVPYVYGRGAGVKAFDPKPWHPHMDAIGADLEKLTGVPFEVCFLNRYEDQRDHLGWHADDSPEMDDGRPIAIISLGVERFIEFKPQKEELNRQIMETLEVSSLDEISKEMYDAWKQKLGVSVKLKLEHGSLCLMHAGMQNTHYHQIPKAGFQCGRRISLTYRGYASV
jgi:alkylated DNA repair dioxygenase AlkB